MIEGERTMSFRDLAVKAYEEEDRDREKQLREKLLRSFFEMFGVKPESVNVEERTATVGSYLFLQDITYESKPYEHWILVIQCPVCLESMNCDYVTNLVDVGRKVVAWERDHKCNVRATGEA